MLGLGWDRFACESFSGGVTTEECRSPRLWEGGPVTFSGEPSSRTAPTRGVLRLDNG